jgi:hypothetical protein
MAGDWIGENFKFFYLLEIMEESSLVFIVIYLMAMLQTNFL